MDTLRRCDEQKCNSGIKELSCHQWHCPKCDIHLTSLFLCPKCGNRFVASGGGGFRLESGVMWIT